MYAAHYAQKSYAPGAAPIKPAKDVEYDAFAKITGAMKRARSVPEIAAALYKNSQLWTILACDVADPENSLPTQLRAQIFYLSEFTSQHSSKVLAGKESIDILVEINTSIMRGLKPQSGAT